MKVLFVPAKQNIKNSRKCEGRNYNRRDFGWRPRHNSESSPRNWLGKLVCQQTRIQCRKGILWRVRAANQNYSRVKTTIYFRCFIIEKIEENRNKIYGQLKVNSSFKYNIDYEKYEIIYLNLIVIDLNQEVNSNQSTALLPVLIGDENDNPPEFVGDTLTVARSVVEEATTGSLVGNIVARDVDGPGNNIISYAMK